MIALTAGEAFAATAIGGQQDFTDGQVLATSIPFDDASSGEAAPFNRFHGSDFASNFDQSFTLTVAAGGYASGTITLGLFDHDSVATGEQVAYFGVDGVELTAGFNALLEARGGAHGEYNVYALELPPSALAALQDGSGTFRLALKAPSRSPQGDLPAGNGAGLDFARLDLVEGDADADGDAVLDHVDACPGTGTGAPVDAGGCSIAQLAPCAGPWRNHGQYVREVSAVASNFVRAGTITPAQRGQIVAAAGASSCGR